MSMRRLSLLIVLLLTASVAHAQPGCRTIVLPDLPQSPTSINTTIIVPASSLHYPFDYIVPANGVTTGIETVYYRVNYVTWGTTKKYVQPYYNELPEDSLHFFAYQVLPHLPPPPGEEAWRSFRTQFHSTKLESFENYSVVLQPPRNGLSGEGWNFAIYNPNPFPVQMELQAFFRECVTP